jgi:hypothetical protein
MNGSYLGPHPAGDIATVRMNQGRNGRATPPRGLGSGHWKKPSWPPCSRGRAWSPACGNKKPCGKMNTEPAGHHREAARRRHAQPWASTHAAEGTRGGAVVSMRCGAKNGRVGFLDRPTAGAGGDRELNVNGKV